MYYHDLVNHSSTASYFTLNMYIRIHKKAFQTNEDSRGYYVSSQSNFPIMSEETYLLTGRQEGSSLYAYLCRDALVLRLKNIYQALEFLYFIQFTPIILPKENFGKGLLPVLGN